MSSQQSESEPGVDKDDDMYLDDDDNFLTNDGPENFTTTVKHHHHRKHRSNYYYYDQYYPHQSKCVLARRKIITFYLVIQELFPAVHYISCAEPRHKRMPFPSGLGNPNPKTINN